MPGTSPATIARLDPVVARLEGLEAEAVDIADEVRQASDGLEADLGSVAQLEERLGALYGLLRKYGESEEAALAQAAEMADEVARLEGLESERDERATADGRLLAAAEAAARVLSDARQVAGSSLAAAVTTILQRAGLPRGGL